MKNYRAQGAIEKPSAASAGAQLGQGATEYLVLLAVVLIVALVSVALLGFFPGMASDTQRVQSETYWKSTSPVAITEWAARAYSASGTIYPYFRIKNNGVYPIRITGIVGADGNKATGFYGDGGSCGGINGFNNMSDYFYLGPGEEKTFGITWMYGLSCYRDISIVSGSSGNSVIGGATSLCANSTASPGTLVLPSMGFEYIEYLDNNQQITKRQIGKQMIIKCLSPAT